MLNVTDNPTGHSYAYIRKDFGSEPRRNISLEYEIYSHIPTVRDVFVSLIRGENGLPLAGVIVGENGNIKLKVWNYNTYPSQSLYPSKNTFPKGTRRTFPPFYPSSNVRPGQQKLFPPFYPGEFPTIAYSGESLNYYPGNSQPKAKTVTQVRGKTFVRLSISRANSINSEAHLFVNKMDSRGKELYSGLINWKLNDVKTVDLGCALSIDTPYSFSFENIKLIGDVPSEEWYSSRDYQGFKVSPEDSDILWVGAGDIDDPSTFSEPTKLENLARYSYVKPLQAISTPTEVLNIDFDSDITFEEVGELTFSEIESPSVHPPKGIRWTLT
jgi:hypothetical protein